MIEIFKDFNLKDKLESNILFEGVKYYIDVSSKTSISVYNWINDEQLSVHLINYHPNNPIIVLKFDNVVGYVNIFDVEYDIRSTKLLDGLNGKEQFKILLDDIISISNKLTFSFNASTFGRRKSENSYNLNDLEAFDYYYQLVFSFPNNSNLDALLNQCFKFPHSLLYQKFQMVEVSKSKAIPQKYFSNFGSDSTYSNINETHSLGNSAFVNKTFQTFGKRVFPSKVLNLKSQILYNSKENQFLKFFLNEINILCLRVYATFKDDSINLKAKQLQAYIFKKLQNPFLKKISALKFLPGSSSVLLNKAGYRELYFHFIQSKLSFRPILEDYKKILHNSKLKNIANLYEIWVFFKIAEQLFGGQLIGEIFNGKSLSNGNLIESYTWEGKNCKLHYNKSYSKNNLGSYSVTLRPDISLQLVDSLFLFDAKYKFDQVDSDDEALLRFVKAEDIHKMHTYLDAIPSAKCSIVIYPGNHVIFYDKSGRTYIDNFDLSEVSGVGAIPALPNFTNFASYFKSLTNMD